MIGPSSIPPGVTESEVGDCASLPGVSGAWTSLVTVLVAVSGGEVTVLVTVAGGGVTVAGVVTTAVVAGGAMGASPPQPAGKRSSAGTVMIVAANLEILMTTPLMMGGARGAVADGAGPVTDPAQGK